MFEKANNIISEIQSLYLSDNQSWVVGYSGGKDSTALVQLIFYALLNLQNNERKKDVHIISSNTLVEIPNVVAEVESNLKKMQKFANERDLPVITNTVAPTLNDTFFVNLIGRGYPSPNSHFRWCTDRLKIYPTSRYILQVVDEKGEVIILLGARKSESSTRAQVLSNYAISNSVLRRHSSLPRCFVYTPIEEWTSQEVWYYLLQVKSPWGANNRDLFRLYSKADAGECPLVVDTTTPSCGNSRFGCWVCTVVEKDKSIEGFIESGEEKLEPLLNFTNWLRELRNDPDKRETKRKNGADGKGPFKKEVQRDILRRLLEIENQVGFQLISVDELLLIQRLWREGDRFGADANSSVSRIIKEIKGDTTMYDMVAFFDDEKDDLLLEVCNKFSISIEMIERLKAAEEKVAHLKRREDIFNDIDDILDQEITN